MDSFFAGFDVATAHSMGLLDAVAGRPAYDSGDSVSRNEAVASPVVYLAHPYADAASVAAGLQPRLETAGFTVINPFQRPEQAYFEAKIKGGGLSNADCADIVQMDLAKIDASVALVASLTADNMVGTLMEIFYCAHVLKRPVYAYAPREREQQSPWVREHAMLFTSHEALVKAMAHELL